MTVHAEITRLTPSQFAAAGAMLSRAYHDDPLSAYMVPDPARRTRILTWLFAKALWYGATYGEVYTTSGRLDGVIVWLPAEHSTITLRATVQTKLYLAPLKLGLRGLGRFINQDWHISRLHHRLMPKHSLYLFLIGVEPARKGYGIGSALLQSMLIQADTQGQPCYLGTEQERNLSFYQKHGFHVVGKGTIPFCGPHFWAMLRPAMPLASR